MARGTLYIIYLVCSSRSSMASSVSCTGNVSKSLALKEVGWSHILPFTEDVV